MKPPSTKTPAKKRNLAAKALANPAFRPKVVEKPVTKKREKKFSLKSVDDTDDGQIN